MAITTKAALDAAMVKAQRRSWHKGVGNINLAMISTWVSTFIPAAGVAPTTAAVPTSATLGALPYVDAGAGETMYVGSFKAYLSFNSQSSMSLYDRLSHQAGLSGNINTAQTTNLPTAALTRGDTTGADVEGFLEVYTTLGATPTTATISYTNEAGTAGSTGTATVTATAAATRLLPIQLQAGDRGIRSVESVTFAAATGTVGNFGVTLARKLVDVTPFAAQPLVADAFDTRMAQVPAGACLWFVAYDTTSAVSYSGYIDLIKG